MSAFDKYFEGKYSKKTAAEVVHIILADHSKMKDLMDLFLSDNIRVTQRAAWPLGMLGEHNAELIKPYNRTLLNILKDKNSADTVVRNILRTWKEIDFEDDIEGEVYDVCFSHFINLKNAIAIRVFSMYVCTNICCKYPELAVEIIPEIELNLTHNSPAIRSSSRSCLKLLHLAKSKV